MKGKLSEGVPGNALDTKPTARWPPFPPPPMALEHKLAKGKLGDRESILLNEATLGQEKSKLNRLLGKVLGPVY